MLQSLRIRNFRSIRDSGDLDLSDVNVLVGPNNSGKSSILYALMLLRMSVDEKNPGLAIVTSTPELDLGSYLDLIRGGVVERNLSIDFTLDRATAQESGRGFHFRLLEKPVGCSSCHIEFAYDQTTNRIEVQSFTSKDLFGKNLLSVRRVEVGKWKIAGRPRKTLKSMHVTFSGFFPILLFDRASLPKPRSVEEETIEWHYLSRRVMLGLTSTLQGIRYIAPIRERIPRYGIMGTMPYSELSPSGQNLMRVLSDSKMKSLRNKTLMNELNYWLNTRFKLLKNVHMTNVDKSGTIKTLLADDRRGARDINLASTGCGISQLVPVIVHTVLMPESSCLLVEQPEIHLHPSAQADLADLFVENAKHHRQFIIETHSEHFILRLRRRIAEGRIKPEKVRVFAVEKIGGQTRIKQLNLKSDGNFKEWPKGFFEEGYREALAIAQAENKE
ncbi:MAG: DUF3696 domain-containing protein [Candidatus Bathyarchaeota archaeon]|nr:DUF3696 domain-containing protein [Candidatus Bathyarchaeota archaeon]